MNQLEKNIICSFRLVKQDILDLKRQISLLNETQSSIVEVLTQLKEYDKELYKKLNKENSEFIASKTGQKFHIKNCPFAKNISKENRISMSKRIALNQGFKACKCVY